MPIPYGLDDESLDGLGRMLRAFESGQLTAQQPTVKVRRPPIETRIAQATSTIPRISGSTPGQGTADVFVLANGSLTDTTNSVVVYNLWNETLHSGDWLILAREPGSGGWFVIFCNGLNPPSSSSSASSGGSTSGVTVVTDVECDNGLVVDMATLTGTVLINGVSYPVTFTLTGGGSGS